MCNGKLQEIDYFILNYLSNQKQNVNINILFIATGSTFNDAVHITAIVGESVVFNCQVEFPAEHPVPYVLQWEKKVSTVFFPIIDGIFFSFAW